MADSTTARLLLTDEYQEIMTGPGTITVEQGQAVEVIFSISAPSVDDARHSLYVNEFGYAEIVYPGGLTVYMRRHQRYFSADIKTVVAYTGV